MATIELDSSNWQKVISETTLTIVDFWASWCPWCMRLLPIFEEVSGQYEGRLIFAKVNVEEQQEIAQANGISGIPILKLFCNGRNIGELVGYMTKEKLVDELDRMLSKVSDCLVQSSVLPKEVARK